MTSLADLITAANEEFDRRTQERHDAGAEKYGPLKFLEANVVEEAMQEILDLANYARYTFIKLWLMNVALDKEIGDKAITLPDGFYPAKPPIGDV